MLNDISASGSETESKTSSAKMADVIASVIEAEFPEGSYSKVAMVEELCALNAMTPGQAVKIAAEVTKSQAEDALKRLKELERREPSAGQLARGAGIGAVAGPVAAGLSKAISGGAKAGVKQTLREAAGSATSGAIFGGAVPFARHKAETGAEKQKLKEYVGHSRRGTLRGKIKRHTGL